MHQSLLKTMVRCITCLMALTSSHLTSSLAQEQSSALEENDQIALQGTIEKIQITQWQYGTHILTGHIFNRDQTTPPSQQIYALQSKKLSLDTFIGKQAVITGHPVSGYPLEGGPALIEVTNIAMTQREASKNPTMAAKVSEWSGVYYGRLPCQDCIAIEATLTLTQQGHYQLKQKRLKADGKDILRQSRGKYMLNAAGTEMWLKHSATPWHFKIRDGKLIATDTTAIVEDGTASYFLQKLPN